MRIFSRAVHETPDIELMHDHDSTVQLIGDILPFVLTKYGIDLCDDHLAVTHDSPHKYDVAI